jgi:DNA (cytosine-5)-methyltransferase 1
MLTMTDFFCGAGGSSTGAAAAGVQVKMAANHWQLAIDTHSTNHPEAEHDCNDLRAAHPSWYPRTDLAWFSPECTNHSLAKGKKRKNLAQRSFWDDNGFDPEEERSRATMREVVEFTTFHRYDMVIVENVVDIRYWMHYDEWLQAMIDLGYEHQPLYLNASFFGVPQSRDRIYIVFWRKGIRRPNLRFDVPAVCKEHGEVMAYQAFKDHSKMWGKYGARKQYIYRCPHCHQMTKPYQTPAAHAIDWTIPVERIGDRKKPLKEKTMKRIEAGLKKIAGDMVLNTMPTVMTHVTPSLAAMPWMLTMRQHTQAQLMDAPLSTLTAGGLNHALIYNYHKSPAPTLTTVEHLAMMTRSIAVEDCGFRMLEPHELKAAMSFPNRYIILGNKRQQVKQVGNAVCCMVAEAIVRRCVEALEAA